MWFQTLNLQSFEVSYKCAYRSNKCPSHLVSRSNSGCNQKGWETLRCGLEQYFDQSQPANLPMGTWRRDSTRYLPCVTLREKTFWAQIYLNTFFATAFLKMYFGNVCWIKPVWSSPTNIFMLNTILIHSLNILAPISAHISFWEWFSDHQLLPFPHLAAS